MVISITGVIVDIIIVAIIISMTYMGYRRGLSSVLYQIIAFVVSLILVFILYQPVSNTIIDNTQIDENISNAIKNTIPENILVQDSNNVQNENNEEKANVSNKIVNMMSNYATEAIEKAESDIATYVSLQIAYFIIRLGTMIILYVASRIILVILRFATNIISSLPVISTFDKSGGLIFGILKSIIFIYAIFAILSALSPLISSWGIISAIQRSWIGSIMYNNNFLLNLIVK